MKVIYITAEDTFPSVVLHSIQLTGELGSFCLKYFSRFSPLTLLSASVVSATPISYTRKPDKSKSEEMYLD